MGYIIVLSILVVVLVFFAIRLMIVFNFRTKNQHLSDKELQNLIDDLYFDLDDFGYNWQKALEYRTAIEMLKERGKVA